MVSKVAGNFTTILLIILVLILSVTTVYLYVSLVAKADVFDYMKYHDYLKIEIKINKKYKKLYDYYQANDTKKFYKLLKDSQGLYLKKNFLKANNFPIVINDRPDFPQIRDFSDLTGDEPEYFKYMVEINKYIELEHNKIIKRSNYIIVE